MGIFTKSILVTPPVIGGVELKPFSAFHALALIELDSPFLSCEVRAVGFGDLVACLIICSSDRSDGLKRLAKRSSIWWWLWCLFHNQQKIADELSDHIISSLQVPETWQEQSETSAGSTGANWAFYVVSVVAQNIHGIDYDRLWDMPLMELVCHKVIIAECNGDVKIAESEIEKIEKRRQKHGNN